MRLWGRVAPAVVRGAVLAGLAEAVAIARYDILMGLPGPGQLLWALAAVVVIVAASLLLWSLPALALQRLLPARWQFKVSFSVWLAVVVAGRSLLADRSISGGWWMLALAVGLVWIAPELRWWRLPAWLERLLCDLAVLAVAVYSLQGRVPDFSYPRVAQLRFLLGSAAVAWILLAAAQRLPRFLAAAAALLALASAGLGLVGSRVEGPNVLWILVDTTRQDHVSPFGRLVATPAIDRLAAQGVLFEEAVTVVPKTPASVASFFTARYPVGHGVRTLHDRLADSQATVAEAFAGAGYETAAFVNNAWLSKGRGFGQGFKRFFGFYEVNRPYGPFRYLSWVVLADRLTWRQIRPFDAQTSARVLTDRVIDFLERRGERPFFAYVHYFEPHWPYLPGPEYAARYGGPVDGRCAVNRIDELGIGRGLMIFQNFLPEEENEAARRLYKGEVDETMAEIGRLLERLDALGLRRQTIVAFTSDHGHALGEHDYYFHHGEFLYDESLKIPLILSWPGRLPEGAVVKPQVRSLDLAPTLLELAGVEGFPPVDGVSLRRFWEAEAPGPLPAFLESDVKMFSDNVRRELRGIPGKQRGLRDGRFKLILDPKHRGPAFELYDLETDPGETHNLASDPAHAEILAGLRARLLDMIPRQELVGLARMGSGGAEPGTAGDASELEMLRSLGYVE